MVIQQQCFLIQETKGLLDEMTDTNGWLNLAEEQKGYFCRRQGIPLPVTAQCWSFLNEFLLCSCSQGERLMWIISLITVQAESLFFLERSLPELCRERMKRVWTLRRCKPKEEKNSVLVGVGCGKEQKKEGRWTLKQWGIQQKCMKRPP